MKHDSERGTVRPDRLMDMANAFYDSCTLFAASDKKVFAALARLGEATSDKLADELGLAPRAARLLLDACAALRLLHKEGDVYRNAPEAEAFLVPGQPGDLSRALRYNRDVYSAWGQLAAFLDSGAPVERPQLHLGDDTARTRAFVLAMHGRAMAIGRAVVPQLALAGCRRLLDVGGGPGTYAALLAEANPQLHCTVLDLPGIVAVADELIAAGPVADRITTLPGDYHTTPFPPDQDVIIFFGVLHQESPESIRDLMKRAHAALRPGGQVVVMDMMTDPTHTAPTFSAMFALNMALTTANGWVFASDELEDWMTEAGLEAFTCAPLPPPMPHWLASAQRSDPAQSGP